MDGPPFRVRGGGIVRYFCVCPQSVGPIVLDERGERFERLESPPLLCQRFTSNPGSATACPINGIFVHYRLRQPFSTAQQATGIAYQNVVGMMKAERRDQGCCTAAAPGIAQGARNVLRRRCRPILTIEKRESNTACADDRQGAFVLCDSRAHRFGGIAMPRAGIPRCLHRRFRRAAEYGADDGARPCSEQHAAAEDGIVQMRRDDKAGDG